MSSSRLRQRIKNFEVIGVCRLERHDLRFHKVSKDGSGKCDAYGTGKAEDFVLGVLYEIDRADQRVLDRHEDLGHGYDTKEVFICLGHEEHQALTYVATRCDENQTPYTWYVRHVVEGAREAGFPEAYINKLMGVISQPDPDKARHQ